MAKIHFACPHCGHGYLVARQEVIEWTEITDLINDEHAKSTYGKEFVATGDVLDTEVQHIIDYECNDCGEIIAYTEDDLVKWLYEHGQVEQEEEN